MSSVWINQLIWTLVTSVVVLLNQWKACGNVVYLNEKEDFYFRFRKCCISGAFCPNKTTGTNKITSWSTLLFFSSTLDQSSEHHQFLDLCSQFKCLNTALKQYFFQFLTCLEIHWSLMFFTSCLILIYVTLSFTRRLTWLLFIFICRLDSQEKIKYSKTLFPLYCVLFVAVKNPEL